MKNILTDEGFVLKRISYQEKDLILHILSKKHGKLCCFAKAAKNSKKRFGASLELASHIEFVASERSYQSGMLQLQEANSLMSFDCIRQDYVRMIYVFFCLYVLDRLLQEEDKNVAYFEALKQTFLNFKNSQQNLASALTQFCVCILKTMGLWPEIKNCYFCLNKNPQYFNLINREIFPSCLQCGEHSKLRFNFNLEFMGDNFNEEEFFDLFYVWFKNYLSDHLSINIDYYYYF